VDGEPGIDLFRIGRTGLFTTLRGAALLRAQNAAQREAHHHRAAGFEKLTPLYHFVTTAIAREARCTAWMILG